MMWTQKESSLLEDLIKQERLCVEKYGKYQEQAHDPALKQLFGQIGQVEQQHEQTVTRMISGALPPAAQGQGQQRNQNAAPSYGAQPSPDKQQDAYLCEDALGTEKHVSSVYDVSIFEFRDPEARQALNHLQSEEQRHGEMLYAYMARNGMYQAN